MEIIQTPSHLFSQEERNKSLLPYLNKFKLTESVEPEISEDSTFLPPPPIVSPHSFRPSSQPIRAKSPTKTDEFSGRSKSSGNVSFLEDDGSRRKRDSSLSEMARVYNARVQQCMDIMEESEDSFGVSGPGADLSSDREGTAERQRLFQLLDHPASRDPSNSDSDAKYASLGIKRRPHTVSSGYGRTSPSRDQLRTAPLHATRRQQSEEMNEEEEEDSTEAAFFHRQYGNTMNHDLEQRIKQLRADLQKRHELEESINKHKGRKRETIFQRLAVHQRNIDPLKMTDEEREQIRQTRHSSRNQKLQTVAERKKKIDAANEKKMRRLANRREIMKARQKKEMEMKKALEKKQRMQKTWLVIVALTGRFQHLASRIDNARSEATELRVHTEASIKIQRAYRSYRRRIEAKLWRKRMTIVHRTLRKYIWKWLQRRRTKASDMILHFLNDLQDVNHIVAVIRKFRFEVRQTQNFWRQYWGTTLAQLQVLKHQWDSVEANLHLKVRNKLEIERRKEDIQRNAQNYTSIAKKIRAGAFFKAQEEQPTSPRASEPPEEESSSGQKFLSKALPLMKVNNSVKEHILLENLRDRKVLFATRMISYLKELKSWEKEEKERKQLEDARQTLMYNLPNVPGVGRTRSRSSSVNRSRKGSVASRKDSLVLARRGSGLLKRTGSRALEQRRRDREMEPPVIVTPSHPKPVQPAFVIPLARDDMISLIEKGVKEMAALAEKKREAKQEKTARSLRPIKHSQQHTKNLQIIKTRQQQLSKQQRHSSAQKSTQPTPSIEVKTTFDGNDSESEGSDIGDLETTLKVVTGSPVS